MFRQKNKNQKGFTIIEVVISIAIFAMISMALLNMFSSIMKTVRNNKAMLSANNIASEQLEIMRGMEFNNVGTVEGWGGPIPSEKTIFRGGTNFTVKTDISWVDDPFDGLDPVDTFPFDYKNARVRVSWKNSTGSTEEFAANTNIVPEGLEGLSEGRGGIYLTTFDSKGVVVYNADVKITSVNAPFTLTNGKTDLNGNIWVPDLVPANDYHIEVTKAGYSTAQTYAVNNNPASPDYNPIPERTDAMVNAQKVTKMGFSIDTLGNLNIKTFHFSNPSNWQVNADTLGEQTDSAMALSPSGQLFVAFADNRETESYIYLQKFNYDAPSGTYIRDWISDAKVVNHQGSSNPELKFTPDGSLFLVWDDSRTGDSNIYLEELNPADGSLIGSEFAVSHDASATAQKNPSMDADQDNNLYLVWEDYRDANWDIYSQRFTAATSVFWTDDYKVNTSSLGEQLNAKIIVDRDGSGVNLNNSYIFWQSNHLGNFDIFLSKFDKDHQAIFSEKQINAGGSLGQYEPTATYDGSNYFYVAWTDERNSQPDIYMQKIDKSGNRIWATGDKEVNDDSYATARRIKPSIGYGGVGAIYISWEDNRNGDAYSDIYTSKVDSTGARLWTYDLVVADYLSSVQTNASTVCDVGGKAVTIWQDNRGGTNDIFAARYSEMGNLQRANVEVTVISGKNKGTYPNPDYIPEVSEPEYFPIPKYSNKFVSDAGGNIHITGIEWGSYSFTAKAPYTVVSFDLPSPITVAPGGTSSIVINVDP